jgi:(S)-citramalyl-CoA lyase
MSYQTRDIALCRCLLFTPANRPERFEKAAAAGADGVILDLEDGVGAGQKAAARDNLMAFLKQRGRLSADRPFLTAVRINGLRTADGLRDLLAIAEARFAPDALVIPKVESPGDVDIVAAHLQAMRATTRLLVYIESGRGLEHATAIAAASPHMAALLFGAADLAADLGAEMTWEAMLWGRCRVVQAAAAAGLVALDVPFFPVDRPAELEEECRRTRALGYAGKLAIHPNQVATIVGAYTPDEEAVVRARRVLAAHDAAAGDPSTIEGAMVDEPIYRAARRVIALADAHG